MNIRRFRLLLMILMVCALPILPLHAKLQNFPLAEYVHRAEFIIVGDVVKLEKTEATAPGLGLDRYRATIEIERTIKGDPSVRQLSIDYTLYAEEPQFRMGRALLFVTRYEGRLIVVQGFMGLLPITRRYVSESKPYSYTVGPIDILNEPKSQKLDELIK